MKTVFPTCAVLFGASASVCLSADFAATMLDHQVAIASDDNEEKLTIDLRPAVRRWPAPALTALKEWSAKWP